MATIEQITRRWAEQAGTENPKLLHSRASNVYPSGDGSTLYSYGSHFPLARIMPNGDSERGWFLVNGDRYSVSTSRHQSHVRSEIAATGLPSMIVPFSALDRAGIGKGTITPVSVEQDRTETVLRHAATLDGVPERKRPPQTTWRYDDTPPYAKHEVELDPANLPEGLKDYYAYLLPDGRWEWQDRVHHLGQAVFTAGGDYYVSAFDGNERNPLYFLAQLPGGAAPRTVDEALEALKPRVVRDAEADGAEVLRQGDVFAIKLDGADTRTLTKMSQDGRKRMAYVLGVNHTATESLVIGDLTYARGTLRHRPREFWRQPEHRNVKLGDGKTWFLLAKNTVPEGRSWSIGGGVD